jgi:hypothetical protein
MSEVLKYASGSANMASAVMPRPNKLQAFKYPGMKPISLLSRSREPVSALLRDPSLALARAHVVIVTATCDVSTRTRPPSVQWRILQEPYLYSSLATLGKLHVPYMSCTVVVRPVHKFGRRLDNMKLQRRCTCQQHNGNPSAPSFLRECVSLPA